MTLTSAEADNALYVAFEGLVEMAPAVVGILQNELFEQFVCDPILMPAAAEKNISFSSFNEIALQLEKRCSQQNRRLVALCHRKTSTALQKAGVNIEERTCSAESIAAQLTGHSSRARSNNCLQEFLSLVSLGPRPHLRQHNSPKRLRAVRTMIRRKDSYEKLTRTVKGQWSKLLQHNENECRSLRDFVVAAVSQNARENE